MTPCACFARRDRVTFTFITRGAVASQPTGESPAPVDSEHRIKAVARGVCGQCQRRPISRKSRTRCRICLDADRLRHVTGYHPRSSNRCARCGNRGHNRRTCRAA